MGECREIITIKELGPGRPNLPKTRTGTARWLVIFNANARADGHPVQVWHAWREDTRERAVEKVTAYNHDDYDGIEVIHTCIEQGSEK